jgi:opacity protein-like surface antigen
MKKLIALGFILVAGTPFLATAKPKYVEASVGYFVDAGEPMYSGRFGYVFSGTEAKSHSAELEIGFTALDIPGASVDVMPVLVNYKYTFQLQGKLNVFAGAGVGFSMLNFGVSTQSDTDYPLTYQVVAGIDYRVTDKTDITLGARYYDIGDAEVFTIPYEIGNDIEFALGCRFRF